MKWILSLFIFITASTSVYADCGTEQTWCETSCKVRYVNDDAGKAGCISRCVAERAACSTKAGAESAIEYGKGVYQDSQVIDQTIGCDGQQEWCESTCATRHPDDKAAKAGCVSRCVAERAACSTSVGADKAIDLGKDAWDGTKSFFKGLTE